MSNMEIKKQARDKIKRALCMDVKLKDIILLEAIEGEWSCDYILFYIEGSPNIDYEIWDGWKLSMHRLDCHNNRTSTLHIIS